MLPRWALSYNLRSEIAEKTHEMFGLVQEDTYSHNESAPARIVRDNKDEESLISVFEQHHVFSPTSHPECLFSIATKDLATFEIQESLLGAKDMGQKQVKDIVQQRLTEPLQQQPNNEQGDTKVQFTDTMHKNNALTFDSLYQVAKGGKEKEKNTILRADRSVLQRLIVAYGAGREVDLHNVLSHELMSVPISLADTNGKLRTGQKAALADVLTRGIECPSAIDLQGSACLLIDGMALVAAVGKPADAQTFGAYADRFQDAVLGAGSWYQQIHVLFDRYEKSSIKAGTRERRTRTIRPVRRVIENKNVPLPNSWSNFLALPENKANLAKFLSEHLIANAPQEKVIVVAGGFSDGKEAQSSNQLVDPSLLCADHEEADTRLVLHAIVNSCDTVVVSARDTDVLLLLVAHLPSMPSANVWMMAGTAARRKFFNIRAISENLPVGSLSALLPFHALTGCDTTSYISNHSKLSAWKTFQDKHYLLASLGEGELSANKVRDAEKFICAIYNCGHMESVNDARVLLFSKTKKPEALPPTKDALELHIKRVHYQSLVWKQASCQDPILPNPDGMGWKRESEGGSKLVPLLMTKEPIPNACKEIISCSCKSGCTTLRCGCKKAKLFCTGVCGCSVDEKISCKNKCDK